MLKYIQCVKDSMGEWILSVSPLNEIPIKYEKSQILNVIKVPISEC